MIAVDLFRQLWDIGPVHPEQLLVLLAVAQVSDVHGYYTGSIDRVAAMTGNTLDETEKILDELVLDRWVERPHYFDHWTLHLRLDKILYATKPGTVM